MRQAAPTRRSVRFGAFEVDLQAGELRKSGIKLKLQEQPFRVLALLKCRYQCWNNPLISKLCQCPNYLLPGIAALCGFQKYGYRLRGAYVSKRISRHFSAQPMIIF